jgi:HK97 family phage prohead protease
MADEKTTTIASNPSNSMWREQLATNSDKDKSPSVLKKEFIADIEVQDDRTVKFVISTGGEDREKDIIDPSGWSTDNYMSNPVVMFAHDYNSLPVAKTISLETHGDSLVAIAQFAEAELNPLAEQVFQMLKGGFLTGASVGFRPTEFSYNETRGGVDFAAQELLEFSVVPVPANPQALIAAGVKSDDVDLIVEWARRTLEVFDKSEDCKDCEPESDTTALLTMQSSLEKRVDSVEKTIEKAIAEFRATTELLVTELRSREPVDKKENDVVVFELDEESLDTDGALDIDIEALASSLNESVREAVGSEVEKSINALRGRVN